MRERASQKKRHAFLYEHPAPGLTDFRRHADLALRHDLGVQFIRFESEHLTGVGVKPVDRDADAYILENS